MNCSCFHIPVEDYCEILSEKIISAKRNRKCCECNEIIIKGEKYLQEVVRCDSFEVYRTCLSCFSVREHLFCDWIYTMIWYDLDDIICDLDDDEIPWSKIAKCGKPAQYKIFEIIEDIWEEDNEVEIVWGNSNCPIVQEVRELSAKMAEILGQRNGHTT